MGLTDLVGKLSPIRIVLVETTHPGNIGSVARAMKTMGLTQLVLVNPKQYPDGLATAMASGAADVLMQARVVSTLTEAIADCAFVIGTSARQRASAWPQVDARGAAALLLSHQTQGEQVALVFGRESSGLTNLELDACHYLGHVPTNPDYGSLYLAMGVQIFTYELWMQAQAREGWLNRESKQPRMLATHAAMEGFYQHLEETLSAIEFLDQRNHEPFMRRMRRMLTRTELEANEVTMLRGILRSMLRIVGLVNKHKDS